MRYLQFKDRFQNFVVISLADIRQVEPTFDLRRLVEWQDKGYIKQIRRGFYILSKTAEVIEERALFAVANKIYQPSYVSLESALAFYDLIPEAVFGVTSVTSRKTNQFKTGLAHFSYRSIKPELMFGYGLVDLPQSRFKQQARVAFVEKTILDWLYFHPNVKSKVDVSSLRLNLDELLAIWDWKRFEQFKQRFNSTALAQRAKAFEAWLKD
jgi:predicted transcriptional regulator of viral defense system